MEISIGFKKPRIKRKIYKLEKALYSLKQTLYTWYGHVNKYFYNIGFKHSISNINLYLSILVGKTIMILLYVDDLIVIEKNHFNI